MTDDFTVTLHDVDSYPDAGVELVVTDLSWTEPISEAGSGQVVIQNDLLQPGADQLVHVTVDGTPAFTFLTRDFERVRVAPRGEGAQQTTHTMPGHLALLEDALVYPTTGIAGYPKQLDIHFDWRHPLYDDSGWSDTPQEVTSVEDAKTVQSIAFPNGWPIIPWADDMPANEGAQLGSKTMIVWATGDGSISTPMSDTSTYFRQAFYAPWEGVYAFFLTTDDDGDAWIDGVEVANTHGGDTSGGFASAQIVSVRLSVGDHILAVRCTNWPQFPGILNLAGAAWALYIPGYPPTLICQSYGGGDIKYEFDPPEPPGMTYGNALRLAIELAQTYGEIPEVTLGFSDTLDSNGDNWAVDGDDTVLPCIATKVLNDLLTFVRESSATYGDVRMDPASWELQAYNLGAMNATDTGLDFLPGGNVEGLSQSRTFRRVNAVIGEYQGTYLEVTSAASPRKAAQFQIGSVDTPEEATRVLTQALADYQNPREEISVQVDGPVPYVDYPLGGLATTENSTGAQVQRRIVAISVSRTSTGRAKGLPKLGDLFL